MDRRYFDERPRVTPRVDRQAYSRDGEVWAPGALYQHGTGEESGLGYYHDLKPSARDANREDR